MRAEETRKSDLARAQQAKDFEMEKYHVERNYQSINSKLKSIMNPGSFSQRN
jgi:hypothetical protein